MLKHYQRRGEGNVLKHYEIRNGCNTCRLRCDRCVGRVLVVQGVGRLMANPSKNKGTAAETAVVRYAWAQGFTMAERIALAGSNDQGDVVLMRDPKIILEVKAGKSAQTASLGQISKWLEDTRRERDNAKAAHGFLIVQRQGFGNSRVAQWECWTLSDDHGAFIDCSESFTTVMVSVENMFKAIGETYAGKN